MSGRRGYRRAIVALVGLFVGALVLTAFAPAVLGQVVTPQVDTSAVSAGDGCAGPAEPFLRTELYFGSNKPDGSVVTEAQFQRFLNDEITPRFPDGLTLLTGLGQFKNSSGVIEKERSMLLILFYPKGTARSASTKIDEIRTLYERKFDQESVLRADLKQAECVSF